MKAILIIIVLVAGYMAVSTMSHNDSVAQAAHCAHMVQSGAWPQAVCNE